MTAKRLDQIEVKGALAKRTMADGRRSISLNRKEKNAIAKRRLVERAVQLFLDIEEDHTWKQIAEELGISVQGLKNMTKTDLFMEVYDEYYTELGHDPRVKSARAAITDMVPAAVRGLKELLNSSNSNVRLSAVKEVMRMNGLTEPEGKGSEKGDLAQFLKDVGIGEINIVNNNLTLPPGFDRLNEYKDAIDISAYTEELEADEVL